MNPGYFLIPITVILLTIVILIPAESEAADKKEWFEVADKKEWSIEKISIAEPGLTLYSDPTFETTATNTVTFYGTLRDSKKNVISDEKVQVEISGVQKLTSETDSNGNYKILWETSLSDIRGHKITAKTIGGEKYREVSKYIVHSPDCSINLGATQEGQEGKTVFFQGVLSCSNLSVSNRTIEIRNIISGQTIESTKTNSNGVFSGDWTAVYQSTPYNFQAKFVHKESEVVNSNVVGVSVKGPGPELILEDIPSVEQGATVTFKGKITHNDFQGDKILIKNEDGFILTTSSIDDSQSFVKTWNLDPQELGLKTVYVTCSCNGRDLQSNDVTFIISANDSPKLQVDVIAGPTSGEAPLKVAFEAVVSGGVQPYQYNWNIESDNSKKIEHVFDIARQNPYYISLTVTDSNHQKVSDSINIHVTPPISEPEIIIEGNLEEGSKIGFSVDDHDLGKVDSYRWDFGDKQFGYFRDMSHSYDDDGQYKVKLTVSGPNGKITLNETIDIKNKPPKITSLNSIQNNIEAGKQVNFKGKFTDPGKDDTFTVTWHIENKENVIELNSPKLLTQNYTFEKSDNYTIILEVRDDDGGKAKETLSISVKDKETSEDNDEESILWILVSLVVAATSGGGIVAAKTFFHTSDLSPIDTPNNSSEQSRVIQPTITVEYGSGIEK